MFGFKKTPEIDVTELKNMLDSGEKINLIDVRDPDEYTVGHIEGSVLIPLGQLSAQFSQIDKSRKTVVLCRSGARSARAVDFLIKNGFTDIHNLAGGILAWRAKIDPAVSVA